MKCKTAFRPRFILIYYICAINAQALSTGIGVRAPSDLGWGGSLRGRRTKGEVNSSAKCDLCNDLLALRGRIELPLSPSQRGRRPHCPKQKVTCVEGRNKEAHKNGQQNVH